MGKIPVLKVDDEVLFESAVINEYLDEITGGELQPDDPLQRAKNRAWIEFASDMLGNSYLMKTAAGNIVDAKPLTILQRNTTSSGLFQHFN